jgi:hypothetical protein
MESKQRQPEVIITSPDSTDKTSSDSKQNSFDALSQASNKPSAERVLSALDFEINQISSEQQRPGWTIWAVYGGLASSLWLLSEQWEKGTVHLIQSIHLFLIFSVLIEIVRQSGRFLPIRNPRDKVTNSSRPARFQNLLKGQSALVLFLYSFRFILITAITIFLVRRVWWWGTVPLILYFGMFSLISLVALITLYVPTVLTVTPEAPRAKGFSKKKYYFFWLCMIVLLSVGLTAHLVSVRTSYPNGVNASDLRFAGLLIVISFLLPLIPEESKNRPLLSRLKEIRRDLAFGWIDVDTALQQADIALTGMPVDDVLQEDIRVVLEKFEKTDAEYKRVISKMDTLLSEIPANDVDITKEILDNSKSTLKEFCAVVEKESKESKELKRVITRLRIHRALADHISSDSVSAAQDVLQKIESAQNELTEKAENLLARLNPALKRLTDAEDSVPKVVEDKVTSSLAANE